MNRILIPAALILLIACSSTEVTENKEQSTEKSLQNTTGETSPDERKNLISEDVDAAKFKELMALENRNLVDVRTPDEFIEGSIEDAVNIDFNGNGFETEIGNLDRNKPVLVFCQAGGRSGKAKEKMEALGFTEIYNLLGGYGSWPYK